MELKYQELKEIYKRQTGADISDASVELLGDKLLYLLGRFLEEGLLSVMQKEKDE